MAVPLLEPLHRVNDMTHAAQRLPPLDEAQLGGRDDGGERIADVGGRGLVVGQRLAPQLVVVGDKPVGLLSQQGVKVVPRVLRHLPHLGGLAFGEGALLLRELLAQAVHDQRRRTPKNGTEHRSQKLATDH